MIWTFFTSPSTDFKINTLPRQEKSFVKNVLKMHKWETVTDVVITDKGIRVEFPTTVYVLRNGYIHQTWVYEQDTWVNLGPELQ